MAFYNRKLLLTELRKPGSDSKPTSCSLCKPNPGAKHPIPTLLVLSLGIVGALFLFLSYFAMRRFAGRQRSSPPAPVNYTNREDFTEIDHPIWYIRTVGLPQSVVDSIQMVRYKKEEGLIETSDCSVCLSEFGEGERLRLLHKCSHAFHVACIDTWLRSHTNCPLCRAPVNATPVELSSSEGGEGGGGGGGGGDINVEDDGVVVNVIHHHHQEQEMIKAVTRRSVSMDLSSNVEPSKPFSINRSISFTFYA